MAVDSTFKDFVLDQLGRIKGVHAKGMFGGFGLYADHAFFGLIYKGKLYFRTNEHTRERYEACGMKCFMPKPKQGLKNYFQVPVDIIENSDELEKWAKEAVVTSEEKLTRE